MGHFFILHYLIEFTVQFPGFFLYLSQKKYSYLIVVESLRKKTNKTPSPILREIQIYNLIEVIRSFGDYFFSCGDGKKLFLLI